MKKDLPYLLAQECIRIMNDAINTAPKVPVDTGALASSGSVLLDNELVQVSPYIGGETIIIHTTGRPKPESGHIGTIIFAMPYAYKVHSGQVRLRSPEAGPEFLSSKLNEDRLKNIANKLRLRK
jgi:hypothetical protein